ncbi:alpha/beta hydrolase [Cellulomonas humilata]|uniref:Alpha/beta hydrolase n=1 Tax=Cellulomonas humilata TaxID=144055 RepID=A0A7Y6DY38_9CELL|nr:alpha/beta hydrolase [Cellulomonas humilata]NUU17574.1 alpha/beta hydrolase [Cellulomonas humilata]
MAPSGTASADVLDVHARTVTIDGYQLAVRSTGAGDRGRPVFVLVHGLGMSHRYLARLQRELAPCGTTHCIDLPGFGGTRRPGEAMSIAVAATLLGATLDLLGVHSAVLVGHSMGAQFVSELAVQRPPLASHLVLIGPAADPRRARRLLLALDLARDALREPLSGNALTTADYVRCGPRWYLMELAVMLAFRTDARVRHVQVPTLVIRGGDDPIARERWCTDLSDVAGRGSLVQIPGHRHLVQHSAAERTAAAVLQLVRADSSAR